MNALGVAEISAPSTETTPLPVRSELEIRATGRVRNSIGTLRATFARGLPPRWTPGTDRRRNDAGFHSSAWRHETRCRCFGPRACFRCGPQSTGFPVGSPTSRPTSRGESSRLPMPRNRSCRELLLPDIHATKGGCHNGLTVPRPAGGALCPAMPDSICGDSTRVAVLSQAVLDLSVAQRRGADALRRAANADSHGRSIRSHMSPSKREMVRVMVLPGRCRRGLANNWRPENISGASRVPGAPMTPGQGTDSERATESADPSHPISEQPSCQGHASRSVKR